MNEDTGNDRVVISLHLRHPIRDLEEDCREAGWNPSVVWNFGDERRAPNGRKLGGVRNDSYCSINLDTTKFYTLSDRISHAVSLIRDQKPLFRKIVSSGGSASLFIGYFLKRDGGDSLDWKIMGELSELNMSIDLNIYTPENSSDTEKS